MLNRRRILTGTAFGGIAAALGSLVRPRSAAALTLEPMPAPVQSAYALACKGPAAGGGHAALIADAQKTLRQEVAAGTAKVDTVEVVYCPICGCRFTVTADSSF
jgi:hypothetical protein